MFVFMGNVADGPFLCYAILILFVFTTAHQYFRKSKARKPIKSIQG